MDRQTLSIMKACEVVGVSRRTIYNWIAAGKVQYIRTAGGAIRTTNGTLKVFNGTFEGNTTIASNGGGGAIYAAGIVETTDSSFVGNLTGAVGGAIMGAVGNSGGVMPSMSVNFKASLFRSLRSAFMSSSARVKLSSMPSCFLSYWRVRNV